MELIWIDDFIALERLRHFTKAAEMRGTTQSAYSRRIMRLEEWLGCRLFERDTRPVILTAQGREFLTRAHHLREDILDARRAVNALASHYQESVKIYTTNTLAVGFFPDWVARENIGPYSLTVASLTGCVEAVRTGRAASAVIPLLSPDNLHALPSRKIGQDHLCLMATPAVAVQITVRNRVLHGPLLLYPPGTAYGALVARMLAAAQITLAGEAICESPSAEALTALAASGAGAAWLPRILASDGLVACEVPKSLGRAYDIALIGRQNSVGAGR